MTDLDYRMIGTRIRAYRRERGLTQEQLAEDAEISPLSSATWSVLSKKPACRFCCGSPRPLGFRWM